MMAATVSGVAAPRAIDLPTCSICLCEYGSGIRKPVDLGCGHCICGRCHANLSISGPKICPIDREPWKNPHTAYELLSLVEQLQSNRGNTVVADEGTAPIPPGLLQHSAPSRWYPPDPFRPLADILLTVSNLWRALTWPSMHGEVVMDMGFREVMGHLSLVLPNWVQYSGRIIAPVLIGLTAQYAWRYIAAMVLLLVPCVVTGAAGIEMQDRTWPAVAAFAVCGLLGSAASLPMLLACGMLQRLIVSTLLLLLVLGVRHSFVCDCVLATVMRRRWVQASLVFICIVFLGLELGPPRLREVHLWILRNGFEYGYIEEDSMRRIEAAVMAAAAIPQHVLDPRTAFFLFMRGVAAPMGLLLAVAVLENYRNCLTTGGPAFLDVDQTNSNNVLIGIATRYDLDWILLRVFTFIGVLCCSGSWRVATAANIALHGISILLRLVASNSRLLQLFRYETAASSLLVSNATTSDNGVATRGGAVTRGGTTDRGRAVSQPSRTTAGRAVAAARPQPVQQQPSDLTHQQTELSGVHAPAEPSRRSLFSALLDRAMPLTLATEVQGQVLAASTGVSAGTSAPASMSMQPQTVQAAASVRTSVAMSDILHPVGRYGVPTSALLPAESERNVHSLDAQAECPSSVAISQLVAAPAAVASTSLQPTQAPSSTMKALRQPVTSTTPTQRCFPCEVEAPGNTQISIRDGAAREKRATSKLADQRLATARYGTGVEGGSSLVKAKGSRTCSVRATVGRQSKLGPASAGSSKDGTVQPSVLHKEYSAIQGGLPVKSGAGVHVLHGVCEVPAPGQGPEVAVQASTSKDKIPVGMGTVSAEQESVSATATVSCMPGTGAFQTAISPVVAAQVAPVPSVAVASLATVTSRKVGCRSVGASLLSGNGDTRGDVATQASASWNASNSADLLQCSSSNVKMPSSQTVPGSDFAACAAEGTALQGAGGGAGSRPSGSGESAAGEVTRTAAAWSSGSCTGPYTAGGRQDVAAQELMHSSGQRRAAAVQQRALGRGQYVGARTRTSTSSARMNFSSSISRFGGSVAMQPRRHSAEDANGIAHSRHGTGAAPSHTVGAEASVGGASTFPSDSPLHNSVTSATPLGGQQNVASPASGRQQRQPRVVRVTLRGGLLDDLVWASTYLVILQWMLYMPPWTMLARLYDRLVLYALPWARLTRLLGGSTGMLLPSQMLSWASVIVVAAGGARVMNMYQAGHLRHILRPCVGPNGPVDVRALWYYFLGVAAAPVMVRLLKVLWAPLPLIYLTLAANVELAIRAALVLLQSMRYMGPLPLSSFPFLPFVSMVLFRQSNPRLGLLWPHVVTQAELHRGMSAVWIGATLGLDPALSQWMGRLLASSLSWFGHVQRLGRPRSVELEIAKLMRRISSDAAERLTAMSTRFSGLGWMCSMVLTLLAAEWAAVARWAAQLEARFDAEAEQNTPSPDFEVGLERRFRWLVDQGTSDSPGIGGIGINGNARRRNVGSLMSSIDEEGAGNSTGVEQSNGASPYFDGTELMLRRRVHARRSSAQTAGGPSTRPALDAWMTLPMDVSV